MELVKIDLSCFLLRDMWISSHLVNCSDRKAQACLWMFQSVMCLWELTGLMTRGVFLFSFKDFIYVFLERGGGREKERERNTDWLPLTHPQLGTWPATQTFPLTGNWTGDLLVHSLALNPLTHTAQGRSPLLCICTGLPALAQPVRPVSPGQGQEGAAG